MNLIFVIAIVAYLYFVVPVLVGVLEAGIFRKEKKCVSEILTNGYLITLGIFCVIAVVLIQQRQSLLVMSKVWMVVIGVLSILAFVLGRNVIKNILEESKLFWKSGKKFMLIMMFISMVVSVTCTKPSVEDITVLIVDTAVETDTMYLVNPYSGYGIGTLDTEHAISPIEMFYALSVMLTGADSQVVIYYLIPIMQLIVFFLVMWRMACGLFKKEEQRVWFEIVTTAIYWMTVCVKDHTLLTGIFVNSWNGLTVLSCIILPLALSMIIKWMQQAENGMNCITARLEKCVLAMALVLAGQLTHSKGGFYVMLMLFLCAAVMIVRGGDTYGIKARSFKKRI